MLAILVLALALVAPSSQGSTYRLLKQYGEQKLNEACYGYEAQRTWKYNCHKAEEKCKAKGYKVSGHDYLPFMPSSSYEQYRQEMMNQGMIHQGQASKPVFGKYEPAVYAPRPNPGPTSTVTLYPSTQYYPYQQLPAQLSPANPASLAQILQAFSAKRMTPMTVHVPSEKKYFQRTVDAPYTAQQYSGNSQYTGQYQQQYPYVAAFKTPTAAAFKTPLDSSAAYKSPVDYYSAAGATKPSYYSFPGYPSVFSAPSAARRVKREAVHTSKPTADQLEMFEKERLEKERDEKESEIMGTRCVMQEMGYLKADDTVDLKYSKEEIKALEIEENLKQHLTDVMDGCYQLAMNLPEQILRQLPVEGPLAKSLYYFKCNDKMSTKVCLKHEITSKMATKASYKQIDLRSSTPKKDQKKSKQ